MRIIPIRKTVLSADQQPKEDKMLDQLRVFFCVVCGGKGSSGGAEPHPYNGPRGECVIINAISVFHSRGEHCSPAFAVPAS